MIKVGITGGIGAGKSTVCQIFRLLQIPVYDSDKQSRLLQESNIEIINATKQLLGNDSYLHSGKLNREYISKKIFEKPELLTQLNRIVHPVVIEDSKKWFESKNLSNIPYAIKESALLFSAGLEVNIDFSIVVQAPTMLRIKRVLQRDSTKTEKQILAIIESQKKNEIHISKSDFTIINDEKQSVIAQVLAIDKKIKSKN